MNTNFFFLFPFNTFNDVDYLAYLKVDKIVKKINISEKSQMHLFNMSLEA